MTATMTWHPADRAQVDRDARYLVKANDGITETMTGSTLYSRLRPEFLHGRPVFAAVITEPE